METATTTRRIQMTATEQAHIAKVMSCTTRMVRKALAYDSDTDLAKRIRQMAIVNGGRLMNWLPECETLHCADGKMRQTFQNGATITVDWAQRTVSMNDGKGTVTVFGGTPEMTLETFHSIQALAESM